MRIKERSIMNRTLETAIFAGGCFWGMEYYFEKCKGVSKTSVGYTGGHISNPTYEDICTGTTGHAEAVKVIFSPELIDYQFLVNYFFRLHDPTTLNRQKNDTGPQYRSAIFYLSQKQKKVALEEKNQFDKYGGFENPAVTEIVAASTFFEAEENQQSYLEKNPLGYNCHSLREDYKK